MVDSKKLFLLDGMSLIYRAHFALSDAQMMVVNQMHLGPIFGFVNTLLNIIEKEVPTHIAIALDTKGKTFRHKMYQSYKADRPKQPDAITVALPYIKDILDGFGIPCFEHVGYEADDLIGTLARQSSALDIATYIVSTDKDLAQVVSKNVYLYKPAHRGKGGVILNEAAVLQAWSVQQPSQIVDFLALAGDPSDQIPGVPYIGKKTAQKLIHEFGSLENILKQSTLLKGKVQKSLIQYAEQAKLSKKLATICVEAPIQLDIQACQYGPNKEKLMAQLNALGLKKAMQRLTSRQLSFS